MSKTWKTIKDSKVRHIWAFPDGSNEISIDPSFYADNGTPMCCGDEAEELGFQDEDMIYVRTEILVESSKFAVDEATENAAFITGSEGHDVAVLRRLSLDDIAPDCRPLNDKEWQKLVDDVADGLKKT